MAPAGSSPAGGPSIIRVVLADDQPLVRAGFRLILVVEDDITVAGEADDSAAAVALATTAAPNVVLMDIRMPGLDGLAATRAIGAHPELAAVRILILTTFELGVLTNRERHRTRAQPATVRTHVGRAMLKLSARDRAKLVIG